MLKFFDSFKDVPVDGNIVSYFNSVATIPSHEHVYLFAFVDLIFESIVWKKGIITQDMRFVHQTNKHVASAYTNINTGTFIDK